MLVYRDSGPTSTRITGSMSSPASCWAWMIVTRTCQIHLCNLPSSSSGVIRCGRDTGGTCPSRPFRVLTRLSCRTITVRKQLEDGRVPECKLTPTTRWPSICFCTLWPYHLDFWPFDQILIAGRGLVIDYPCGKLVIVVSAGWHVDRDVSGFIVRTNTQTDADECFTPATIHGCAVCPLVLKSWCRHTVEFCIVLESYFPDHQGLRHSVNTQIAQRRSQVHTRIQFTHAKLTS